jgi:hypothetical protein
LGLVPLLSYLYLPKYKYQNQNQNTSDICGFHAVKIAPRHFIWSENACVMAKKKKLWPLISGSTEFLFFGGHIFRQFKSGLMPPELPG